MSLQQHKIQDACLRQKRKRVEKDINNTEMSLNKYLLKIEDKKLNRLKVDHPHQIFFRLLSVTHMHTQTDFRFTLPTQKASLHLSPVWDGFSDIASCVKQYTNTC